MTSNIKVVDIEEGEKEVNEAVETIPEEANIENAVEQTEEVANETIPEPRPEPKKDAPIPVEQTVKQNVRQQDKLVKCPKCDKQMKLKSYRYKHELSCKGKLEDIPKKPKAMPKKLVRSSSAGLSNDNLPKAQPIIQEFQEVQQPKLTQPVSNQILQPQPRNPLNEITNHYQILHRQYIQQKKEKYDALCKNMFSTKIKKP